MQEIVIMVVSAIILIIIQICKFKMEKKDDPKVKFQKSLAENTEKIFIFFLSTLTALYITNFIESNKTKNQIITMLNMSEQELTDTLDDLVFHMTIQPIRTGADLELAAKGSFLSDTHHLKIADYLYTTPVITKIDPWYAANILETEKAYEQHIEAMRNMCDPTLNRIPANEEATDFLQQFQYAYNCLGGLIRCIEVEKAHLHGKNSELNMPLPEKISEAQDKVEKELSILWKTIQ